MVSFQTSVVILCLCLTTARVTSSAIPMWEYLSYEEKLSKLFSIFIHLVEEYCKGSSIPDCRQMVSFYGMSNLIKMDPSSLDLLDPYQRNARELIWKTVLNSKFKLPPLTVNIVDDTVTVTATMEPSTTGVLLKEDQNEVVTIETSTKAKYEE